ncbi:predicted protein [Histoplasma capsulatum var. duboisii H88]|uniref:Predicted protein n=1 Tax=Ajellomyces capsulatus (strain H88) TaxID=544711 RepID=F0UK74_AJEC8|nr:predicted protein [Histoplasma capsulatum var. duboisii H88]
MTYPLSASFCSRFNISKPPLPYASGRQFTVRSHNPLAPMRWSCALDPDTVHEREWKHPLEYSGTTKTLNWVPVHVSDARPLTTQGAPENATLMAKFYAPLSFDHEQDDADLFLCVDQDYSP